MARDWQMALQLLVLGSTEPLPSKNTVLYVREKARNMMLINPWQRRKPTRCNNNSLLINSKLARHVSGNNFVYHQEHQTVQCSLWYDAPNELPSGGLVTEDLSINGCCCIQLVFFFAIDTNDARSNKYQTDKSILCNTNIQSR